MKDLKNKRVHRGKPYGWASDPEIKKIVCRLSANDKKLKKELMADRHKLLVSLIFQIR